MAITADGTAYDLFGPQHAPAVVLIHGLGMTRATWDDIVPVLARNFRVVTYDLSGHGDSRLPSTTPSLTVLSEQLKTLLETLSIPQAALVGFSLGGMINRRFAIDYRDIVTALIVLNSPHERDPAAQRLVEERAAQTSAGGAQSTIDTTLE
jgi:(E)-2-((N-methylformamido)methylene)succinate hydrolase